MARVPLVALLATAALTLSSSAVWACPACYGEATGPMIDGARLGAWLLIAVVASMWIGFLTFFVYLSRRARRFSGAAALAAAPAACENPS
ncbi:MAG: hypothetical protein U0610_05670 [bacterium]